MPGSPQSRTSFDANGNNYELFFLITNYFFHTFNQPQKKQILYKILIIEDDEDTSEVLGMIGDYLNLNVIRVSAVPQVAEIAAMAPSLILLDHWVGNALGGNLCTALKQNKATAGIPVIMMSAHNKIAQIAKESLADAYLAKPFDLAKLTELVERFVPNNFNR
jgi:DNA-binding response OmpR family regulator